MPKKEKMSLKESMFDGISAGLNSISRGSFLAGQYFADDYRAAKEAGRMYRTVNDACDKRRRNLKDMSIDEFNNEMDACRDAFK